MAVKRYSTSLHTVLVGGVSLSNGQNLGEHITTNLDPTQQWSLAQSATFKKTSEEFGGFSNMAGKAAGLNPLTIANTQIRTSEHLYQACRYPDRTDIQQVILDQASPMFAKRVAKKKEHLAICRTDWDAIQLDIMRWAIRVKLAYNYDQLGREFLLSGQRSIVEIAPKDTTNGRYWGTVLQGQVLVGTNVMGQLLMELRQEFRTKSRQELSVVPTPTIPNIRILGNLLT